MGQQFRSTSGRLGIRLWLAVFLCGLVGPAWGVENRAADFTLREVREGKEYSLSQYKGQVVLLNFFTFFCGPCRMEMPELNQMDQELKEKGFQALGIGLASEEAQLKSLAQQLGLRYPVLIGTDQVSKDYGNIQLVPTTFIIDRGGKIVHKILGARSKEEFLKLIEPLL